ncbi:hypothetical protein EYR41_003355 [Orbilia oligospora]|uniref:Uncharacterized protein n=1 Tax=Orbilia oligospora TaxID=2813651 RepID=A0A7C8TU15_ORBOL|nr:hypothetical protein TWF751_010183 [Orbilia oligospora]TGJ71389.1 hypothetical protein EYR41_003355 [Orbilia oligospora]
MGFDCSSYDFTSPDSETIFLYCPSLPAATFFTVVFGLSALIHIFQAFYHHKWRLSWVIIVGAAWETTSFGLRAAATQNPFSKGLLIPSSILVYLSPLLINAYAYMVLGRMVWYYLQDKRVAGIQAKWLTVIFVWLDIVAFLVQLVGASMASFQDTDSNSTEQEKIDAAKGEKLGLNIYMGGIGFQLFWILIFSVFAWRFRVKAVNERNQGNGIHRDSSWKRLLIILYFTLLMITIRIIFRLVEFSAGSLDTKLTMTEWYFYVLEATPMATACLTWNIFHPSRFLVGPDSEFPRLTRKEKKAIKAEKKRAKEEKKYAKKEDKQRHKEWKKEDKRMRRRGTNELEMGPLQGSQTYRADDIGPA